jgi:signal transduction histidine kinase
MKRFVASFFLGALVLLVLYEASQALGSRETEASNEDAWRLAEMVHEGLAEASRAGTSDPERLEARLGVSVEAISPDAYERACSRVPFVTKRGEVELCVGAADDEDSWRVVAALPSGPIALDGAAMLEEREGETGVPFGFGLILLFAGMAALGAVLAWSPSRQLRRLAGAATALRDGDLDARAAVPRSGLVTPVAMAFNDMATQIQKTVSWQELLLQTVAHEVRTPLSRVRFIAERVSDAKEDAERHDALGDLDLELTEMEALLTSLLSLLSTEGEADLVRTPSDLAELLDDLLERLERRQRHREPPLMIARVGFESTSPLARVDRRAVSRVFDNLLENAAAHARSQVQVTLDLEEHTLMVAIEDDGEGIRDDQRSQILEPFVRLDEGRARAGTGLGLAIVRRLAEAHGHPVVVCASGLGGLRVETRWPLGGEAVEG